MLANQITFAYAFSVSGISLATVLWPKSCTVLLNAAHHLLGANVASKGIAIETLRRQCSRTGNMCISFSIVPHHVSTRTNVKGSLISKNKAKRPSNLGRRFHVTGRVCVSVMTGFLYCLQADVCASMYAAIHLQGSDLFQEAPLNVCFALWTSKKSGDSRKVVLILGLCPDTAGVRRQRI